jgi:hypothetical protein
MDSYEGGKMTTHHFTLTGSMAGHPFCGVDKGAAREAGDTFGHVPYDRATLDKRMADPTLCKACKAEWDAAGDDDEGGNS